MTSVCNSSTPEKDVPAFDDSEDETLYALAVERMAHLDPAALISQEEIEREFGLSDSDFVDPEDLDFV